MFAVLISLMIFVVILILVLVYHLLIWSVGYDVNRVWVSPFECGFLGSVLTENVFSYTYFVLLVFFVIFDLEVSLLLNLPYQGILFKNFGFYLFFLVLLSIGYGVELGSGYVSWNY
nr:NADH dehydrogenase subunit 3 [Holostephanus sp. FJ-2023]